MSAIRELADAMQAIKPLQEDAKALTGEARELTAMAQKALPEAAQKLGRARIAIGTVVEDVRTLDRFLSEFSNSLDDLDV